MQTSSKTEIANFPNNSEGKGNGFGTQGDTAKTIETGSNDAYAVNNIYDMAGNVWDWTIEVYDAYERIGRGCSCEFEFFSASDRGNNAPNISNSHFGCRATLYIQ